MVVLASSDPHNRRQKNVTEFKELQNIANELYSNDDMKKWLFSHTRDEAEYNHIRRTLRFLSHWKPVEWTGRTGERRTVPCRNIWQIDDRYDLEYDALMEASNGVGVV